MKKSELTKMIREELQEASRNEQFIDDKVSKQLATTVTKMEEAGDEIARSMLFINQSKGSSHQKATAMKRLVPVYKQLLSAKAVVVELNKLP
jgi:hypothetical protein